MMICLFALGFAAFAVVNALLVVGLADRLTHAPRIRAPGSDDVFDRGKRRPEVLVGTDCGHAST